MTVTGLTEKLGIPTLRTAQYRGAETVAIYSDRRTEFSALRSAAGTYDLGWRTKIVLTGSDRVRWLNGMITNNFRDLGVDRGVYAFLLNAQGRIQADLYAYNRGGYVVVDSDQSQVEKLLGIFDHYIIMDDVEVSNSSDKLTAIGIAGPKSEEVLRAAGLEVAGLETLQLRDTSWQQLGVTIVRGDSPACSSYEVWLPAASVSTFWNVLVKAGAVQVGSEAYELLRIAAGIPVYGQDIRERDLPQETGQDRAIHFSKGCYVGQEIVERIHSRGNVHRMFTGFLLEGAKAESPATVQVDGKDVGEITSAATLPLTDRDWAVALGYIRREAGVPGKEVQIGDTKAIVSRLPFAEAFQQ
jgi:folate-binding protein YgfZ